MYEFRHVRGHIEVFLNGAFQFSADNMEEVNEELNAGQLHPKRYDDSIMDVSGNIRYGSQVEGARPAFII